MSMTISPLTYTNNSFPIRALESSAIDETLLETTNKFEHFSMENESERVVAVRISRLLLQAICHMVESFNTLKLSLLDIKGHFSTSMYDATSDKSFYQTCQIGASAIKLLGAFFTEANMQQGIGALADFSHGLAQTYVTGSDTGINLHNIALQDTAQKLREDILSQLLQTLSAIQATEHVK